MTILRVGEDNLSSIIPALNHPHHPPNDTVLGQHPIPKGGIFFFGISYIFFVLSFFTIKYF
jgi:hypothetical protein